jgi:sec-independent protein translocase protein TatA
MRQMLPSVASEVRLAICFLAAVSEHAAGALLAPRIGGTGVVPRSSITAPVIFSPSYSLNFVIAHRSDARASPCPGGKKMRGVGLTKRRSAMFEGLFQPMHLMIIAGIALLVFGPKKLPELGKGLGESIRGFKAAMAVKEETPVAVKTVGDGKEG